MRDDTHSPVIPGNVEGSPPSPRHPGLEPGSSITFFAKPWIPHQVRDDTRSCHPELVEGAKILLEVKKL